MRFPAAIGPSVVAAGRNDVLIPCADVLLAGELSMPDDGHGVVVFAHGSGSSRHSPRDRVVAQTLRSLGLGTLQFDLRTADEESLDRLIGWLRFDTEQLAARVVAATAWLRRHPGCVGAQIGYFGAGSGAAAALLAAAAPANDIAAIVCRGGRPDLASAHLPAVRAPTLLLVGDRDTPTLGINRQALPQLRCEKELVVIPGASHLFREPGTLDQVATLSATWLRGFMAGDRQRH